MNAQLQATTSEETLQVSVAGFDLINSPRLKIREQPSPIANAAILVLGLLAIVRTPADIFPNINIPVVSIIWNYNGLVPEDMSKRLRPCLIHRAYRLNSTGGWCHP